MAGVDVPLLYRHILKAAKVFPSTKRAAVLEEIKSEFHANKGLKDVDAVRKRLQVAVQGLRQLEDFSGLSRRADEWEVSLRGPCLPEGLP
eukprot:jgi/Botrbrau1/7480/Bobra.0095s0018.1